MAFRFMGCCCGGGQWFDFYCHPDDGQGSVTIRTPSVCPPNTDRDNYNSEDYTDPWVLASGFEPASSRSAKADFGDYFLYVGSGNYSGRMVQLCRNEIGSNGPTLAWSASKVGIREHIRYGVSGLNLGMDRAPFEIFSEQYGDFRPLTNTGLVLGPDGSSYYIRSSSSVGANPQTYVVIDNAGAETTTVYDGTDYLSQANRALAVARVSHLAAGAFPWACGIKLVPSSPGSGVVRLTWTIVTGEVASDPSICAETNVIATFTEDLAITPGNEATWVANFFGTTKFTPAPIYTYQVGFYHRSPDGDELVYVEQTIRGVAPVQGTYYWYANGTLFDTGAISGADAGIITTAAAVSPDPDLNTTTRFVVAENDSANGIADLVGLDANGVEVWRVEGSSGCVILEVSDRFVYAAMALNFEVVSGGRASGGLSAANFLVRLDGQQIFPFLAHIGASQTSRGAHAFGPFACIKNSAVPLSVDIDMWAQWDGHQGV